MGCAGEIARKKESKEEVDKGKGRTRTCSGREKKGRKRKGEKEEERKKGRRGYRKER